MSAFSVSMFQDKDVILQIIVDKSDLYKDHRKMNMTNITASRICACMFGKCKHHDTKLQLIKNAGVDASPRRPRQTRTVYLDAIAGSSFLTSILSIIGTGSVVGFILWKKLACKSQIQPLLHLSIADFFLAIFWISSSSIYFKRLPQNGENAYLCFTWLLLTEMIHMITFLLTLNYSINVYFQMKDRVEKVHCVADRPEKTETRLCFWVKVLLYVCCWTLPILLLIPVLYNAHCKETVSKCQRCVILLDVPRELNSDNQPAKSIYSYALFTAVLLFTMVMILVFYGLTLRLYWKAVPGFRTARERVQLSNMQTRITLYILAFLISWGPALVISSLKLSDTRHPMYSPWADFEQYYPVYVLQAVLAPLQGFLNSIVYGWSRKSFRNAFVSNEPRRLRNSVSENDTDSISSVHYVTNQPLPF